MEIFVDSHIPMPFLTVLQANARIGWLNFDARDEDFPFRWDHTHWYGTVGASYVNRFIKEFEIGADLDLGFSQAFFPNMVAGQMVGTFNFLSRIGGRISLVPSYGFSIEGGIASVAVGAEASVIPDTVQDKRFGTLLPGQTGRVEIKGNIIYAAAGDIDAEVIGTMRDLFYADNTVYAARQHRSSCF